MINFAIIFLKEDHGPTFSGRKRVNWILTLPTLPTWVILYLPKHIFGWHNKKQRIVLRSRPENHGRTFSLTRWALLLWTHWRIFRCIDGTLWCSRQDTSHPSPRLPMQPECKLAGIAYLPSPTHTPPNPYLPDGHWAVAVMVMPSRLVPDSAKLASSDAS